MSKSPYGKPVKPAVTVATPAPAKPADDDKKEMTILEEVSIKDWNPPWKAVYAALQRKSSR